MGTRSPEIIAQSDSVDEAKIVPTLWGGANSCTSTSDVGVGGVDRGG